MGVGIITIGSGVLSYAVVWEPPFRYVLFIIGTLLIFLGVIIFIKGLFMKDEELELKKKIFEFEKRKYYEMQEEKKKKEIQKRIKEEKEKIKFFYQPLVEYLIHEYITQMVEYYKKKIDIDDIKLRIMMKEFKNKLWNFDYNEEDYELLKELEQMHQNCHSEMINIKVKHKSKIPTYTEITLFNVVEPMHRKIFKKIKKFS